MSADATARNLERTEVLALETSGDVCSAALVRDGELITEAIFRHEMHLSERLMDVLERLLRDSGTTLEGVASLAVGVGPGSFTGTRIGVVTMKTLALLRDRPLTPVNGLEAMAAEYAGLPGLVVVPILPCRAGVVYACPYTVAAATPHPLAAPDAFDWERLGDVLSGLGAETVLFCGPAAARYREQLRDCLQGTAEAAFGSVTFARASVIARLAIQSAAAGNIASSALEVVPLYISPPPITLPRQPAAPLQPQRRRGST